MYMGGASPVPGLDPAKVSAVQKDMLEHIAEAVDLMGAPPDGLTGAEALRELRVAKSYDAEEVAALAAYDFDLISWPAEGATAVPLAELWGEGGHEEISRFCDQVISLAPDSLKEKN